MALDRQAIGQAVKLASETVGDSDRRFARPPRREHHAAIGDHDRLSSSSISSCKPVLAQQLGDAGKATIVGYQGQLGRQRVRGDQQIVAAHRLTALFEIARNRP